MTRKRSNLEMSFDVLKAVSQGTRKPTQIMYKSNLSWAPLKLILERMMREGIIRIEPRKSGNRTRKEYFITKKGAEYLAEMCKLERAGLILSYF